MNRAYLPVSCGDEILWLLPEHAVWWPARKCLLLADVHFGKAAAYRAQGQPVPAGTTSDNVRMLDALLATWPADEVIFLGDFFHAPQSQAPATLKVLHAWRQRHPGLACTLVRGNHDSRAGDPPATLHMNVDDEPYLMGSLALCHHPCLHPTHFVVAGHLHPVCVLRGPGRDRLRLACFSLEEGRAVLPAFGAFTGGWEVAPEAGRQIVVAGGGQVWPLPV